MNNKHHHIPFTDWHTIPMDPDKMDLYQEEDSLFAQQPTERQEAIADALDNLPNVRYRRLLIGLYREHLSPQIMAEQMGVTLPNFYNLHHRALVALRSQMEKKNVLFNANSTI